MTENEKKIQYMPSYIVIPIYDILLTIKVVKCTHWFKSYF